MTDLSEKIAEKSQSLTLPQIRGIFHVLIENEGISNNELVQITGLPKETLKEFKVLAGHILENTDQDSITIRTDFKSQVSVEAHPYSWQLATFEELGLTNDPVLKKFREARSNKNIKPNREWDQFYATAETSVAKALVLNKKGVISSIGGAYKNTKIAFLGDDDMVSVVFSLLDLKSVDLTVFDSDKVLLSEIQNTHKVLNKENVQYVLYDARNNIDAKYYGRFDVVITDPPYTKSGVTLFLNRAIELLDIKTPKYIFLYYGTSHKTPEKTLKIQEIISQMGLVIEDKINNFAHYNGAESIGNTSSLYILKTTPFTKPLNRISDFANLYTHQSVKDDKFPYVDHVVLKLYGVPKQIITSKSALAKLLGEFCVRHKLKVVDIKETKFKNGGLTITYVLSNSNLVVHTWPEMGALHVDLITCAPIFEKEFLGESLYKAFKCKSIEVNIIE